MSKVVKLVSALTAIGGLLSILNAPAYALSVIGPAYQGQPAAQGTEYVNSPVAFTGGTGATSGASGFALSEQEILHVKWCAQKYMSYHASDDTYIASSGTRQACKSPY